MTKILIKINNALQHSPHHITFIICDTFMYSLSLLYQPISRPHAAKVSIIVALCCIKA